MFVCRHWYHVLSKRSLLYDIDIDGEIKLESFKNMVRRHFSRTSQVEILKIRGEFTQPLDNRDFCNMFPNLRVFYLSQYSASIPDRDFASRRFELMLLDTKLEEVKDSYECELTRLLAMTGACTRLRELELDLTYLYNPRQKIYAYMNNIPALKKLTLNHVHFGIQDCEILHSNLPALEVFNLMEVNLDPGELPANIAPATSVTEFFVSLEQVTDETQLPNWYIYMAKKYTNLTRLVCCDFVIEDLDLDQTTIIYRDGIIPLYKNLGKQVTHFDAKNVPTDIQVFKQMDDIGCRFSTCRLENNDTRLISTQLAQSNLAKYIKELEIERTIIDSPSLFHNMINLTTLSVDTDYDRGILPINLTEYLNALSRCLNDLHVNCTDLEISELPNQPHCMRKLWIGCITLSEELVNFILDFFPELDNLILRGGVEESMTMDLSSKTFLDLSIKTYYKQEPHGFSVNSTDGSPVKYYVRKKRDMFNISTLDPVAPEELQDRVTIGIKYSAENFDLSNEYFYDVL